MATSQTDVDPPTYRAIAVAAPPYVPPADNEARPSPRSAGTLQAEDIVEVTVASIKAFLRILLAVQRLQDRVVDASSFAHLQPTERWSVFVNLAVCRFVIWQERCLARGGPLAKELPPLDVVLVWVTYLASPRRYEEDSFRLGTLHPMSAFKDCPLLRIAACISDDGDYALPSSSAWKELTGTPFDALHSFEDCAQVTVVCPRCDESFSVPLVNAQGTGFAQNRFEQRCPTTSCTLSVTKESIVVGHIIDELRDAARALCAPTTPFLTCQSTMPSRSSQERATQIPRIQTFLRHTTAELGDRVLWRRRQWIKAQLGEAEDGFDVAWALRSHAGDRHDRTGVDLVPAILRLTTFIERLRSVGWLDPRRWHEREDTLDKAIQRYHGFLELRRDHPRKTLVPTLGIEMAWQTHMMMASKYSASTKQLLGELFNRDDAVEEGILFDAFDETALLWQTRFGVPYSTSGHPIPPIKVLHKLTEALHGREMTRSVSLAQIDYSHLLIYGETDSTLSHPCERNSVGVSGDPRRTRRSQEIEERVARNMKLADKGKLDINLARRATAMLPAFVGNEHHGLAVEQWTPTGYPCSVSGIIVSGNMIRKLALMEPHDAVWSGFTRRTFLWAHDMPSTSQPTHPSATVPSP